MPDYVLERLALDLRAPELNIPLDIGGSRGRQFAALSQPALQEIRHGRTVLLDRGRVQPPGLGQIGVMTRVVRSCTIFMNKRGT